MSSQSYRILICLPATAPELAAMEETSVRKINAQLWNLKRMGLVKLTEKRGEKPLGRGRWPPSVGKNMIDRERFTRKRSWPRHARPSTGTAFSNRLQLGNGLGFAVAIQWLIG